MSTVNHEYTEEVVCPYCGHEFTDSWELSGEDGQEGETDCGQCERLFLYYRNISVSYSTLPAVPS